MPPSAFSGAWISTRYTGSMKRGVPVSRPASSTRRQVGMIWPPPRWMASVCSTTSWISNWQPRMFSSASGPSLDAHWNAATHESLISFRYCTPLVVSRIMFGPVVSGPKHQILRAPRSLSHPYFSARYLPRALGSSLGVTLPSSMSSGSPSSMGQHSKYRRLCLLGDLDMTVFELRSVTVSRNDTTGSDTRIGAPPMKSSCRSLRQISRCSSPAPAMMCSPVSSIWQMTMGSDFAKRLRPSTSLGRSDATLHSTATRTTGLTENFMFLSGCASVSDWLVMVAVLTMTVSSPTMATVLPHGTESTGSWRRPMHNTVRWMDLLYMSFFSPGT
mmetsp:Transcript_9199/g.28608  ORF Transcript_9199/g.28608 Transcript_9199/m.28608 type:complete len:330 (-) Transcript_9199:1296-2285(-)